MKIGKNNNSFGFLPCDKEFSDEYRSRPRNSRAPKYHGSQETNSKNAPTPIHSCQPVCGKNVGSSVIGANINQPRSLRIPFQPPPRTEHFVSRKKRTRLATAKLSTWPYHHLLWSRWRFRGSSENRCSLITNHQYPFT